MDLIYVNACQPLQREMAGPSNAMPKAALHLLIAAAFHVAPGVAMAHPRHGAELDFYAGFAHPGSGMDHVLAMTAVGRRSPASADVRCGRFHRRSSA